MEVKKVTSITEASMKIIFVLALSAFFLAGSALAQTQLTIYNQNFATVKETRHLDLKKGESEVRVTDITAHLEPDSVVLRDLKKAVTCPHYLYQILS